MDPWIGRELSGRFRVEAFLGRGGMAEVYRARDTRRRATVALKLLPPDFAEDPEFRRRLQREAAALQKVEHPNIVRFFALEEDGFIAFLVLEYVDGITLRRLISDTKAPLPSARILEILRPVCEVLDFAHDEGIVHRDVKPANIMIERGGRVVVTDFGIARFTESATATRIQIGAPAFMSPEQCLGKDLDGRTDIYSLGITLYAMLTGGGRPFNGESASASGSTSDRILWQHVHEAPPPPSSQQKDISGAIDRVVLKALEKAPDRRYQTAMELYRSYEQALSEPAGIAIGIGPADNVAQLRSAAFAAAGEGSWEQAIRACAQLLSQSPSQRDIALLLARCSQMQELETSSDRLRARAVETGLTADWHQAQRSAEVLRAQGPEITRYGEALDAIGGELAVAKKLDAIGGELAVAKKLDAIEALTKDRLWEEASRELSALTAGGSRAAWLRQRVAEEAERRKRLADLLSQARQASAAKSWADAVRSLEAAIELGETSDEAARLLAEAHRGEELARRVAQLIAEAEEAGQAERWDHAASVLARALAIDSGMPDVRAQRDHYLAVSRWSEQYEQASVLMARRDWQNALMALHGVLPQYKDTAALIQRAQDEIDRETKLEAARATQDGQLALELLRGVPEDVAELADLRQWAEADVATRSCLAGLRASGDIAGVIATLGNLPADHPERLAYIEWAHAEYQRQVEYAKGSYEVDTLRRLLCLGLSESTEESALREWISVEAQRRADLETARHNYDVERLLVLLDGSPPDYPDAASLRRWAKAEQRRRALLAGAVDEGQWTRVLELLKPTSDSYPERVSLLQRAEAGLQLRDELDRMRGAAEDAMRAGHWAEAASICDSAVAKGGSSEHLGPIKHEALANQAADAAALPTIETLTGLLGEGKIDEARAGASKVGELEPASSDVLEQMRNILGRISACIAERDADALAAQARAALSSGRLSKAAELGGQALLRVPGHPAATATLGGVGARKDSRRRLITITGVVAGLVVVVGVTAWAVAPGLGLGAPANAPTPMPVSAQADIASPSPLASTPTPASVAPTETAIPTFAPTRMATITADANSGAQAKVASPLLVPITPTASASAAPPTATSMPPTATSMPATATSTPTAQTAPTTVPQPTQRPAPTVPPPTAIPTAPTSPSYPAPVLGAAVVDTGSVTLSWSYPRALVAGEAFDVLVNGSSVANVTSTSYQIGCNVPAGKYQWSVRVVKRVESRIEIVSPTSATGSFNWPGCGGSGPGKPVPPQ